MHFSSLCEGLGVGPRSFHILDSSGECGSADGMGGDTLLLDRAHIGPQVGLFVGLVIRCCEIANFECCTRQRSRLVENNRLHVPKFLNRGEAAGYHNALLTRSIW